MVFVAFLVGTQHEKDSTKELPASLPVVPFGKALDGTSPPLCDRNIAGPSSLPVVMAQNGYRRANRAERIHTINKK